MKLYVNVFSYDFDSVYGRGYATPKLAKEDECRTGEELIHFSFCLEEYVGINRFLKLCIGAMCIIQECKEKNIAKEDIVIYQANFDGENVKKDLKKLINKCYDMDLGKWKVWNGEEW